MDKINEIVGMSFRAIPIQDEFGHWSIVLENGDRYSWEKVRKIQEFVDKHELIEDPGNVPTDEDIAALKDLEKRMDESK